MILTWGEQSISPGLVAVQSLCCHTPLGLNHDEKRQNCREHRRHFLQEGARMQAPQTVSLYRDRLPKKTIL